MASQKFSIFKPSLSSPPPLAKFWLRPCREIAPTSLHLLYSGGLEGAQWAAQCSTQENDVSRLLRKN